MGGSRRSSRWVMLLGLAAGCSTAISPSTASDPDALASSPVPRETSQLITVTTEDWNDFRGELRRFERAGDGPWTAQGEPFRVVIGREGYGWGRGLHGDAAPSDAGEPQKREGDGRSPAGVFGIGESYGYDAAYEGVSIPYRQATQDLRCVDDPDSHHYNRIVSTEDTPKDWDSAELMRRHDELYAMTIVVEHNTTNPARGGGSCIFLHVWIDGETGMSGCTAMPREKLAELADWLEPGAVLVALPRRTYVELAPVWGLP